MLGTLDFTCRFRALGSIQCSLQRSLVKFESFCFQDLQESEGTEPSDWERYAQEEYDLLVAEEGANEQTEG